MKYIVSLAVTAASVVYFHITLDSINPMSLAIIGVSLIAGVVLVSFGSLLVGHH